MANEDKPGETTQFIQKMDAELLGWEDPAAHLREALDQDHLCLYAQPIIDLRPESSSPGNIAMVEVLVRLREEEARMLPPGEFLPAFEHYKMMAELDRWVVRSALQTLARGGSRNAIRQLGVNVSTQTIEEPGFAAYVATQLREVRLAPATLVFEIDEGDALDRRAAAERFAGEIKGIGCEVTLDGFARRSVSFNSLRALRVDYVKVDGTVIRNILRSGSAAAKLKAILRVGEVTGVSVIAECVEEKEVLDALRQLKVGFAQGFGVRKPELMEGLFRS